MRRQSLALILLLLGCETPPEAVVSWCPDIGLLITVKCTVSTQRATRHQSFSLDPRTKNFKARVRGSFTVRKGKVAVVVLGCAEHARIDVVPGAPVVLDCESEVSRTTHLVAIDTFAFGGDAEGLEGKIELTPL